MGYEVKFDIEEIVKKARAFNGDKERAEKLQKTEGYLKHLCPTFEDALFFRAVYSELFGEDKETNNLLKNIIDKMFNSGDEVNLLNLQSANDVDELYKKFKIFAKSAIKKLQAQEIAMIERIQKQTREIETKKKQKKVEKIKPLPEMNSQAETSALKPTLKPHKEILKLRACELNLSNNGFIVEMQRLPRLNLEKSIFPKPPKKTQRKQIGKSFDKLSKEMQDELLRDREKKLEMQKKMPQMVGDNRRIEKYDQSLRLKQPAMQKTDVSMLSK